MAGLRFDMFIKTLHEDEEDEEAILGLGLGLRCHD